jgi:hypothetical protein
MKCLFNIFSVFEANFIRIFLVGVLLYGLSFSAFAQDDEFDYNEEISYGVQINTVGGVIGGGMIKYAKLVNDRRFRLLSLELVNIKHPKEVRGLASPNASPFIFGKSNYLFSLRPQYGQEFLLFKKASEEGVHINAVVASGISIGVTKPYYVYYDSLNLNGTTISVPYTTSLRDDYILGPGNFLDGINQLGFHPGLHFKGGLNFEFGRFNNSVVGLEVGFMIERFFSKSLVLMPRAERINQFNSLYLTFYYGKKY